MDQVHRLETGRISPTQFDFAFLRFRSGRYGIEALRRLAERTEGPEANDIADRAGKFLAARYPSYVDLTRLGRRGPSGRNSGPGTSRSSNRAAQPCRRNFSSRTGPRFSAASTFSYRVASSRRQNVKLAWLILMVTDNRRSCCSTSSATQARLKPAPTTSGSLSAPLPGRFARGYALKAGRFAAVESSLKDIEAAGEQLRLITPW